MKPSVLSLIARTLAGVSVLLLNLSFGQAADPGVIEGRVQNLAAGTYLGRASVRVEGTTVETFTNDIGEYRLGPLPAGRVTLLASFAGMQPESATVTVAPGRTLQQDFTLTFAARPNAAAAITKDHAVMLDAFTVSDRALSAQGAAVQEQKTAPNIKNVVTFEEFGDLGEGNPGEFLKFVPGIEINQAPVVPSSASIRGMPSDGTIMLVDGMSSASPSADVRGGDLIGANIGNIDRIEITKVPTPDLPANAVGGTINIIPKSNLSLTRRALTYNVFGTQTTIDTLRHLGAHLGEGLGTRYRREGRSVTQPGFDLTYLQPVNKSLALSFSAGFSDRVEIRDILNSTWNLVNRTQTASQKNPLVVPRERRLLSAGADFRLGPRHRFSLSSQYTDDHALSQLPTFAYAYGTIASAGPTFSQGGANGTVTQSVQHYNQIRQTLNHRLGYVFSGDTWKAGLGVGFSRAQFNTRTLEDGIFRTLTATLSGVAIRADNLGGVREQRPPIITAKTAAGVPIDPANVALFTLGTATGVTIPLMSNNQVVKFDVSRPFNPGFPLTLKVGGSHDRVERDIRNQTWTWTINPPAAAGGRLVGNYDLIDEAFSARWSFKDGSRVRWMESTKAFALFKAHPEYFQLNEAAAYTSGVNGSKLLYETIDAGFLRADAKFFDNRLLITTGARYERTADEGRGPKNDPNAIYQRTAAR